MPTFEEEVKEFVAKHPNFISYNCKFGGKMEQYIAKRFSEVVGEKL